VRVLFDLNILIDVACRWQAFPASLDLYNRIVASPTDEGMFAGCGYTTLYYVIKQLLSEERTQAVLAQFRQRLVLLPFNARIATAAHLLQMSDLEDACIAVTAFEGRCEVIATRNVIDFSASPIPARFPEEILADLGR
jgi:hypothetical protein